MGAWHRRSAPKVTATLPLAIAALLSLIATGGRARSQSRARCCRGARTSTAGTRRLRPQVGRATLNVPLSLVEIYHTTFDWPPESEIQDRLIAPAGISEGETARRLLEYHRNMVRILPSYPKIVKVITADQPCVDVFYQGKSRWTLGPSHPGVTSSGSDASVQCPVSRVCLGARESSHGRPKVPAQKRIWGPWERRPLRAWANIL